ncbi:MAG: ATP-grasp fold amidoligase family protein [Rhizobiaceae bacterium]|nr:ATP-grasp fold amidoligase family protein [Rhizobiaceae bacterium]
MISPSNGKELRNLLPLGDFRFSLENMIDCLHLQNRGHLPELQNPHTYSEKIQWLKLHDQMTEQVICCNKILARTFVSERIGKEFLPELYHVSTHIDDPQFGQIKLPFMLKTNHDSGSVFHIHDQPDLQPALKVVGRKLQKPYGVLTGEWAYFHISPLVFAERMMPEPLVEYKFHCCDGVVKWAIIIKERISGKGKGYVVDQDCRKLPLSLDFVNEYPDEQPECPRNWHQMLEAARELSRGFRYVRIDLYTSESRTYFSEMTFWPTAGYSSVNHDAAFGDLMEIDLTTKKTPIHSEYRIPRTSRLFREIRRSDLYGLLCQQTA